MKQLLLLIALLAFITGKSQIETTYQWHFGENASIDFSTGIPAATTGSMISTIEGCASISDDLGNLLFYSDGRLVWDASHNVMPNGSGLLSNGSIAQGVMIFRDLSNPDGSTGYRVGKGSGLR